MNKRMKIFLITFVVIMLFSCVLVQAKTSSFRSTSFKSTSYKPTKSYSSPSKTISKPTTTIAKTTTTRITPTRTYYKNNAITYSRGPNNLFTNILLFHLIFNSNNNDNYEFTDKEKELYTKKFERIVAYAEENSCDLVKHNDYNKFKCLNNERTVDLTINDDGSIINEEVEVKPENKSGVVLLVILMFLIFIAGVIIALKSIHK